MPEKPVGERIAVMEQILKGIERIQRQQANELAEQKTHISHLQKFMWALTGGLVVVAGYAGINIGPVADAAVRALGALTGGG